MDKFWRVFGHSRRLVVIGMVHVRALPGYKVVICIMRGWGMFLIIAVGINVVFVGDNVLECTVNVKHTVNALKYNLFD